LEIGKKRRNGKIEQRRGIEGDIGEK